MEINQRRHSENPKSITRSRLEVVDPSHPTLLRDEGIQFKENYSDVSIAPFKQHQTSETNLVRYSSDTNLEGSERQPLSIFKDQSEKKLQLIKLKIKHNEEKELQAKMLEESKRKLRRLKLEEERDDNGYYSGEEQNQDHEYGQQLFRDKNMNSEYLLIQKRIRDLKLERQVLENPQLRLIEGRNRIQQQQINNTIEYYDNNQLVQYGTQGRSTPQILKNYTPNQDNARHKPKLRLYELMQNNFERKQELSKQEYERNLNYIKSQKSRLHELQIQKHEKEYMDKKFNSQLERYNPDLNYVHDLHIKGSNKLRLSPILKKMKQQEIYEKHREKLQQEEKYQLFHKKVQYAKYVNDFIRPTVKVKSQERILQQIAPIKRKVQVVNQPYSNFKSRQERFIEKLNQSDMPQHPKQYEERNDPEDILNHEENVYISLKRMLNNDTSNIQLKPAKEVRFQNYQQKPAAIRKSTSQSSYDSNCSDCKRAKQQNKFSNHLKGRKHHSSKEPIPKDKIKKSTPLNNPYDWKQYVDSSKKEVLNKEFIIKQKAIQLEDKANLIERHIRQKKREESVEEIQEINGKLVGALKAKLSIIDSFDL